MTALTLVAQGAELNTHNLRTWMLDNVVPLLLLAVAVLLLWLGGGIVGERRIGECCGRHDSFSIDHSPLLISHSLKNGE